MQNIQDWLANNRGHINSYQQPINDSVLRQLLAFLLKKNNAWLYSHSDHNLSTAQIEQLDQWLTALKDGLPLAYITGEQNFWDLTLKVNQQTLIPRPDTEILLEVAIKLFSRTPAKSILDLGTGSGALALALGRLYPAAEVIAVDQSAQALEVASINAKLNAVNNTTFIQSNWFSHVPALKFDLIVSNPPYIAENDEHLAALKHEPFSALVAADNGLADFKQITEQAAAYLKPHGWLLFEHGWQQKSAVQQILRRAGFIHVQTQQDLGGNERVTSGQWLSSTDG